MTSLEKAAERMTARLKNMTLTEMKALNVSREGKEALGALRKEIGDLLADPIVAEPVPGEPAWANDVAWSRLIREQSPYPPAAPHPARDSPELGGQVI